jgi:hypothetical protein
VLVSPTAEACEQRLVQPQGIDVADAVGILDQRRAVGDDGVVDRVPVASEFDGHLVDAALVAADLFSDPPASAVGHHEARRCDVSSGLGERSDRARSCRADPAALVPHQPCRASEGGEVDQLDGPLVLHPHRTVNAPVTASTAAVNSWTGGDCDWAKSLTVVCYGGAISGLSNRTFVTGSTINTSKTKFEYGRANGGNLHRHETWHTRQWALFGGGALFPLFYGAEALRTWGDECQNWFEIWAGLEDGGY